MTGQSLRVLRPSCPGSVLYVRGASWLSRQNGVKLRQLTHQHLSPTSAHGKDGNIALSLKPAPLSDPTVMLTNTVRSRGDWWGTEAFSVHSCSWESLSELQLTAGQLGTAQREGPSFTAGQWKWGAWNWAAWWPLSWRLRSHSMPLLWKESGAGVSGVNFFFFFLFLPKVYFQCLSNAKAQFTVTVH